MDIAYEEDIPFLSHFSQITDPRLEHNKRHNLCDILFIAVCAVLCGANHCVAIADFAKARQNWLRGFIPLEGGPPSHDTISRVLSLLNPGEFEHCFTRWVASIQERTQGEVIPIDGKTIRRSYDTANAQSAIHMVSAWGSANGLVLGQVKTDSKSNEITAIPLLLRMLDIEGCIITMDAMGTQKKIASQIIEQKGDYVMALKDNHPNLAADIEAYFERNIANHFMDGNADTTPYDFHKTVDADHGRIETRRCWCTNSLSEIDQADQWRGLQSIIVVEVQRQQGGETSIERRYFISSMPPNAKTILKAVRTHWTIENGLHWVLDVTFREGESRVRKGNAPQIKSAINKIVINLCKTNTTRKAAISRKRNMAAWDEEFLTEIVTGRKIN